MKAKGLFGFGLVALAGLACGYWLGHSNAASYSTPKTSIGKDARIAHSDLTQPNKKVLASRTPEEAITSIAEIEKKLSEAKERIRPKEWEKILDSVGTQDFAGL